jgi:hypothetical protein
MQYPTSLASSPLLHGATQLLIQATFGAVSFSMASCKFVLTPRAGSPTGDLKSCISLSFAF